MQVCIYTDVGGWDWENIVSTIHTNSSQYTTFESPEVIRRGKQAVANQIGTTNAFPIKFPSAFIQDIPIIIGLQPISIYGMRIVAICPFAKSIDIIYGRIQTTSLTASRYRFGIHQLNISQTKHREIGIRESSVATRLSVALHIGVFVYCPTLSRESSGNRRRNVYAPILVEENASMV